ncbi:hypothetical protein DL96DRAFT_1677565 [Flagelloscypha sp. PMI_526]|nr:hypothetical protein DL96DRAFT_1677565 [Flagelloscypha sp. PMI_526]
MASALTTKVDATSAVLQYNGTWHRGGDNHTSSYDDSTFLYADVNSSFVSFEFYGFQVDIMGAYRTNDGRYNAYFDQVLVSTNRIDANTVPASDDDQTIYKTSLFHWQGTEGHHTVSLEDFPLAGQVNPHTNQALMNMDVDYVQWFSTVSHLESAAIDNPNLSFFQYVGDSWKESTSLPGFPAFANGATGHWTTSQGALATFTFQGDRVTLFGVTGPNLAPFSVQVDSGDTVSYSATTPSTSQASDTLGNQVLFTTAGLSQDASHTLTIIVNPQPSQTFVIDYAIVDAAANSQSASSPSQVVVSSQSSLTKGAIAGIATGAAVFTLLLIAVFAFMLRRNTYKPKSYQSRALESEGLSYPLVSALMSIQPSVMVPSPIPNSAHPGNRTMQNVRPPDYDTLSTVGGPSTRPQMTGLRMPTEKNERMVTHTL